ncbi:MAG: hypothetical protein II998_08580 [Clostridia bacterium]|nr:hypothetical protein [Clostridia bacterium]
MKKLISRLALLAVIVFVVYNLISFYTTPEITTVARVNTVEIKYNFDGIVSRNEKLVTTSMEGSGWFDPAVPENQMVKNGKILGVFYDGEIDADTKARLNEINAAIDEASLSSDELNMLGVSEDKINQDITQKKQEIIFAAIGRDMSNVGVLKNDISILLEKKTSFDNDEKPVVKTVDELLNEKAQIESSVNVNKEEIISPCHGVFTTHLDGFEGILGSQTALSMTVDDFEAIREKKNDGSDSKDKTKVCKIVDNSEWWISMLATENDAKNFKIGDEITIRISGESKDIATTVKYISPSKGDKYVITLSSISGSDYVMESRFMNVTVVKESYTGLEVPLSAIRVKNGKAGVYVKTENTTKFRETEIIYKDSEIAIVKMNTTVINPNALLLYDEIIVN